jgi:hypothetical protein
MRNDLMQAGMKLYAGQRDVVEHSTAIWLMNREVALRELRGYFIRQEMLAIVDALDSNIPLHEWTKNTLIRKIEGKNSFMGFDVKWGIRLEDLKRKIERMSHMSLLALFDQVWRFWNVPHYCGGDLEKFLAEHV